MTWLLRCMEAVGVPVLVVEGQVDPVICSLLSDSSSHVMVSA